MEIKRNFSLIAAISIPLLMIVFVAGSIYLPGLFVKPHFNFLYVSGQDYPYGRQRYTVENGRLVQQEITKLESRGYYPPRQEARLFVHDVAKNESREISFQEAQRLTLDPSLQSPDGFEVVYGNRGNGVFALFFGSRSDYNARYLTGHNVSKKLNLKFSGDSQYTNFFQFLGWIQ